jgi:hypothetical protein
MRCRHRRVDCAAAAAVTRGGGGGGGGTERWRARLRQVLDLGLGFRGFGL